MSSNLHFLILEDSDTIRGFLRRTLQAEWPGIHIHEAVEGREALRAMTRERIDLILTDLQMPGMDGRAFISKLRNNSLLRRKSVLVLSGDDIRDLQELYSGDAGIRFLKKPSAAAEICAAARLLLGAPGEVALIKEEA